MYEYPRACRATITNTETGKVETVEAGKTEDALKYEVEAMEASVAGDYQDNCQEVTKGCYEHSDQRENPVGMKYPFE